MTNIAVARLLLMLLVVLAGCSPTDIEEQALTPTGFVHVYSSFSASALLDTNGNGQPDSADTPIKDATFIVTLPGGTEFGELTDDTGYAFVTIPADVEYPITLRMEAPQDSTWKATEPSTITLVEPTGETIQFLFHQSETE
jgi:hypothetical protein